MNLVYIWISFIVLMGISKCDAEHYYMFCVSMLYFTYLYNIIKPVRMSPKFFSAAVFLPSCIIWRILYTYNWFLKIEPLDEYVVVYIMFFYFYILIYTFWEID